MPMEPVSSPPGRAMRRPWLTAAGAALIVVSQAWPWSRVAFGLPPLSAPTRSPSSDVLMQIVPVVDAAGQLDALHASLPAVAGVVVAHGRADDMASAYMVIAMRLWPRPVSFVACAPAPHVEQFRVPHAMPTPRWRIDLRAGHPAAGLTARETTSADPGILCREAGPP